MGAALSAAAGSALRLETHSPCHSVATSRAKRCWAPAVTAAVPPGCLLSLAVSRAVQAGSAAVAPWYVALPETQPVGAESSTGWLWPKSELLAPKNATLPRYQRLRTASAAGTIAA